MRNGSLTTGTASNGALGKFNMSEIDEETREEIVRLIKEGYTEGRLDKQDGTHTHWKLTANTWRD